MKTEGQKVIMLNNERGIAMRVIKRKTGLQCRIEGFNNMRFMKPEQLSDITGRIAKELTVLGVTDVAMMPAQFVRQFNELKQVVDARRKSQNDYYRRKQAGVKQARKKRYQRSVETEKRRVLDYQRTNRGQVNAYHSQRRRQRKALRDSAIMFATLENGMAVNMKACASVPELLKVNWR